jgi:hypothetical protein
MAMIPVTSDTSAHFIVWTPLIVPAPLQANCLAKGIDGQSTIFHDSRSGSREGKLFRFDLRAIA